MLLPLPDTVVVKAGDTPRPAYLIRLNEETWAALQHAHECSDPISLSTDGQMVCLHTAYSHSELTPIQTLNIPSLPPISLESHITSNTSEIHSLTSSPTIINLTAQASTRLSIPFSPSSSAKAADKLRVQTETIDKERQERAHRLNGSDKPRTKAIASLGVSGAPGTQLERATSSPPVSNGIRSGAAGAGVPMIPLKTRVVQLLALGAFTVESILGRVGGGEAETMRVVNVVSPSNDASPGQT